MSDGTALRAVLSGGTRQGPEGPAQRGDAQRHGASGASEPPEGPGAPPAGRARPPGRLERWIPAFGWLRRYRREDLGGDLTAGLTVAVMLVPQGMAYAMLAGLPPIVGLYASTVPLAIYALLGTSRQLAVGPVAMVSLMVASGVGAVASPGSPEWATAALTLALLVGVMQAGMGLLRLGFLVELLSHPVISGFTSAAALLIGLSQLEHLLGVDMDRAEHIQEIVVEAARALPHTHLPTLGLGLGAMAVLVGMRRWNPRAPGALVVVAVTTLLTWLTGLPVAVVGEVPAGLPPLTLPSVDPGLVWALVPAAAAITLVGFLESISVAKAFATRHRVRVDADQELVALGLANVGAAFFGGYPVTGGFSRTAVNGQAGARTGLASLVTAALIVLTLLLLTPAFRTLPNAALAAIVMVAVAGLVDVKAPVQLWRVNKVDGVLVGVTFVGTLTLGIEAGIALGAGLSLASFVRRSMDPHVAVLGRLPDGLWRNVSRHPGAVVPPDVAVLRFDASLYYANAGALRRHVERQHLERPLRAVVLDFSAVNAVDASGAEALEQLAGDLARSGVALRIARAKGPVRDVLDRAHLGEHVAFFEGVDEAVAVA